VESHKLGVHFVEPVPEILLLALKKGWVFGEGVLLWAAMVHGMDLGDYLRGKGKETMKEKAWRRAV
jgi:hypothetical protein